jgi:hypothetical protein
LVAELLVHADDHGVGRLEVLQRRLETPAVLRLGGDAPAGGQYLVDQAGLLHRPFHLEHPQ